MNKEAFLLAWKMVDKVSKSLSGPPVMKVICHHAEYNVDSISQVNDIFAGLICSTKGDRKLVVLVDLNAVLAIELHSPLAQIEGVVGILADRKPKGPSTSKNAAP